MAHAERRTGSDRRTGDRRNAGAEHDVTRIEHENLFAAVAEIAKAAQRLEGQLRQVLARLDALEREHRIRTGV
jgi:hypothetical protein